MIRRPAKVALLTRRLSLKPAESTRAMKVPLEDCVKSVPNSECEVRLVSGSVILSTPLLVNESTPGTELTMSTRPSMVPLLINLSAEKVGFVRLKADVPPTPWMVAPGCTVKVTPPCEPALSFVVVPVQLTVDPVWSQAAKAGRGASTAKATARRPHTIAPVAAEVRIRRATSQFIPIRHSCASPGQQRRQNFQRLGYYVDGPSGECPPGACRGFQKNIRVSAGPAQDLWGGTCLNRCARAAKPPHAGVVFGIPNM